MPIRPLFRPLTLPIPFGMPAISPEQIRAELKRELAQMLPPLTLGLTLVYATLSLIRVLFIVSSTRFEIVAISISTAILLAIFHVLLRYGFARNIDAHFMAVLILAIVLLHSLLHLAITRDFLQSANVMFLVIGIGCFATSLRLQLITSSAVLACALVMIFILPLQHPAFIAFMLLQAIGLSYVLFFVRYRNLAEAMQLRIQTQAQNVLLTEARDAANRANQAKRLFLAHMTHELRTPLTAMLGYCELLDMSIKYHGHSELQEDITQIQLAGNQLKELINRVLDMSKIESGRLDLSLNLIDIHQLAQQVISTVQPLGNQNRNQLHLQLPEEKQPFIADEMRVRQILINLLSNACRFTIEGTISLRIAYPTTASISFEIHDTGIGMTSAQLNRLFQDYTQVGSLPQAEQQGTGLGLALSQRLARLMGGDIEVTSEPGVGTTFRVLLPLQRHPFPETDAQAVY